MTNNIGRPVKIEPNIKRCIKCNIEKNIESFELSPGPTNPLRRRNDCKDCRKIYAKRRAGQPGFYKKQYESMTLEERAEYIRKKSGQNRYRFKTNPEALARKRAYDKSDKGIYKRYINECKRRNRLKRGLQMKLTLEQFSSLINSSCHYCGTENCRGVDRVDSNGSYIVENCQPCCKICNEMKSNRTQQQFFDHIKKIVNNRGV